MYVIVVGAGEVGCYLATILVDEGHDVAIVEANEDLCRKLEGDLDCLVVNGSGVNRSVLLRAGIKKANLVIGVTQVDEVNLVSSMIASRLGNDPLTVARVREVEHYQAGTLQAKDMGLSLLVGPEKSVADQVVGQLSFEGTGEIRSIADGQLVLLELPLSADSPLCHDTLANLRDTFPEPSLVVGVSGSNGLRIPRGDDILQLDERAEVLTTPKNIDEFLILSGKPWHHVRHVLIVGCGSIGFRLARELEDRRLYPTIIEHDRQRAEWVSRNLTKSIVLHGDGTDPQLLDEQLEEVADAVVVLVEDDEKAVVIGMMAKHLGAKKVLVRSDKLAYAPIAHKMGIDALISPRRALANSILHFVRRGHVANAQMLGDHEGEILELRIPDKPANGKLLDHPLKDLDFPRDVLVGGVIRGDRVFIPDGNVILQPGDTALVIALPKAIAQVEKLLS
jgi:trk system potassium uptake protein TrkA